MKDISENKTDNNIMITPTKSEDNNKGGGELEDKSNEKSMTDE